MTEADPTTRLSAAELRRHVLLAVAIAVIGLIVTAGLGLTRQANNAAGAGPDILAPIPAQGRRLVAVAAASGDLDPAGRGDTGSTITPAAASTTSSVSSVPATTPVSARSDAVGSAPGPSAPAAATGASAGSSSAPSSGTSADSSGTATSSVANSVAGGPGARGSGPGDGVFLDSGAAVAAKVSNVPAAPAFDQALVELSAAQRVTDQQAHADLATHANTDQEQARRVRDQAKAAARIRTEQSRLADEQQQAEAAAALLKVQQAALAAGQLPTDSAAFRLPDGTLVRPRADGSWPPSVLAALNRSAGTSGATGRTVTPIARGSYLLSARFGAVGIWATYHTGVDFGASIATPIRAAADGVVVAPVAGDWAGTHAIVAHSDGYTLYAHMLATTVQPGQSVKAGDVLGYVGMTGRASGPHLHFEYYPRGADLRTPYSARDPLVWLAARGVTP